MYTQRGRGGRGWGKTYGGSYSSGRGRGGRGPTASPPNEPRMASQTWNNIKESLDKDGVRRPLMPDVLTHGLPPDPTDSDSYTDKWKKLVLMEFHSALSQFRGLQRNSREPFDEQANVHVNILSTQDSTPAKYDVLISTKLKTWSGAVQWEAKDPTAVAPADLAKMVLKTESGWLYITSCDVATKFPVRGTAVAYNDAFQRVEDAFKQGRAIAFESFTTLIYRFESLCAFATETDADIKRVIESGSLQACCEHKSKLKPVDEETRAKSKLNASQFQILSTVRAPVDFVQGPPGTGKSTFIVEYVKTRLPTADNARVLICTTTNKAIDSLTEKLAAADCGDVMLAVGNATRLGATSTRFLIENRVERHETVRAFDDELLLARTYTALSIAFKETQKHLERLEERLQQFMKVVECKESAEELKESAEEEIRQATDDINALFGSLWAIAWQVKASAKSLQQHELIGDGQLESIEDACRTMRQATTISTLMDAVGQYRAIVLHESESVRSAVRRYIIINARYIVCTAAVAATLPTRMAREMNRCSDGDDADTIEYKLEHVILDEAGAMLEPDVIGTIVHGCRTLLSVGDHHQLPPFTKWQWASHYSYTVSLMMRLSQNAATTHNMMTTQYRMHPHLADIVSSQFYNDALQTAASTRRERTRRQPVVFVDTNGEEEKRGTSFQNRDEIDTVVALVQKERRSDPTQIVNVICFHKPQFKEIRRELTKRGLLSDSNGDQSQLPILDVCTVDSMQGREADVVILSCVRTSQQGIGFLANANRFNVALSRAKQALYVVGNSAALKTNTMWRSLLNHHHVIAQA